MCFFFVVLSFPWSFFSESTALSTSASGQHNDNNIDQNAGSNIMRSAANADNADNAHNGNISNQPLYHPIYLVQILKLLQWIIQAVVK